MLVIKDLLALKQHIDQATFIELKNKAGQMPKLFCFNITQILQHYSKDFPTHNFYQQTCQGSQRSKRDSLITSSKISQQLLHTHFLIPQTRITKHIKVQPKLSPACFELCSILEPYFSHYQSELETTITHISCFKNKTPLGNLQR